MDTPKKKSATIELTGKALEDFETIRTRVTEAVPGVIPTNSDVLRFSLHVAADKVSEA